MDETGFALVSREIDISPPLSIELRVRTAALHRQIERLLGLPGIIETRDEYGHWLARFLGFYQPLESALAPLAAWHALGHTALPASHTSRLSSDLATLGIDAAAVPRASSSQLPPLLNCAQAIGACYVLEGATLGGCVILRDLEARIGPALMGATRFFGSRGDATLPTWRWFRAALDDFGRTQPQLHTDVEAGAATTFRAMLAWFEPFCAVMAHRSPVNAAQPLSEIPNGKGRLRQGWGHS
jgi:heme oxygenase (biliverdin-IX-beta and delta-forming)